jgi:hypothetical protein
MNFHTDAGHAAMQFTIEALERFAREMEDDPHRGKYVVESYVAEKMEQWAAEQKKGKP